LIDFHSWAESRGEKVDVNAGRAITLDDIQMILDAQGTQIRPGDILLFRTGWLRWYNNTSPTERHHKLCIEHSAGTHHFIGLAQERRFVEWLWNNQIAAVAGDQVAFEATPPPEHGFGWLHEHLLGALGCPIGELWDTEGIAEHCKAKRKYEFFLSSVPLCMPGAVASPANAVALV